MELYSFNILAQSFPRADNNFVTDQEMQIMWNRNSLYSQKIKHLKTAKNQ